MMVNRWQPLGKKRSLIRSAFLFVIYGTNSTHRLRITASNSFKGYRGSLRNGTPSASRWSLKILRGIFLKNVFRGRGQPAGVLGDETGFERAHRADISPPDVFFFPWNRHDRVMQVLSLPPSFIWEFLLSTCSASQFCGLFQALSQSSNK